MSQKRTSNTSSIGSILASNLFPINAKSTPKPNSVEKPVNAKKNYVGEPRPERCIYVDTVENHKPVIAHYPYINKEAMAMTMDNYRLFVANYNERITAENDSIRKHNVAVDKYRAKITKKHDAEPQNIYWKKKLEFSRLFLKNCNEIRPALKAKEFNAKADEFCAEHGNLVKKQTFLTIKYPTELIFQQLVHLYSLQLAKTSNEYLKLGVSSATPVKQLNINSWQIATMKRNEITAVNICKATVRNHRARLEEAGILVDYLFKGHKSAVKMNINSQILVVFDAKTGLFSSSDFQHLTPQTCKDLTKSNEATRAIKSNIKKRENGQADFQLKGTPSAVSLSAFLLEHPSQGEKVQPARAEKSVKVSENLSDKLENLILHPQELAEQLAAGNFNNYQRIDKRYLYKEASYGTLTREEFKQLIIQEFFCNAAKIYRGKNVYIGSWKKAINAYMEKMFVVNNGNVSLYNKELMVDKLQEMLWRLNNAQRWFIKTKVNPLFPSDYFDFTRTEKKEIGFEYTKIAYKNHLKYIENKPNLVQKAKKNTDLRKAAVNHSKKFDAKLNLFFKNKVSLDELIDYTTANLPANYMEKLSEIIIKMSTTKYTC